MHRLAPVAKNQRVGLTRAECKLYKGERDVLEREMQDVNRAGMKSSAHEMIARKRWLY